MVDLKCGARVLVLMLTVLTCAPVIATSLSPGEYINQEGGFGRLRISALVAGKQEFFIESVGGNMHMCSVEGKILDGGAKAEAYGETCAISMMSKGAAVRVESESSNSCRSFCGARAGYDGLYIRLPAQCVQAAIRRTRDAFLMQYRRKLYAQARDTLAPVLSRCGRFLYFIEEGEVRNDLAVTLYHLGEYGACRNVLEPLREDAEVQDAQAYVLRSAEPDYTSNRMKIADKTATNLRLCRSGSKALRPPVAAPRSVEK